MSVADPAIWTFWRNWLSQDTTFPAKTLLDSLYARHIVPMINWAPNDPAHLDMNSRGPCRPDLNGCIPYLSIAQRKFDAYIKGWANQAKAFGHPLIIRFAQEMDGKWMPWQVGKFGNSAKNFIAAWRHIVNVFRTVGASNVRFLWSPFDPVNWSVNYYPGDNYVDYVGFTGLNWADKKRPWRSMLELYAQPVHVLAQITKKPVIVAEAGTVNRSLAGVSRKPGWISAGYPAVYAAYPSIAAIIYFDVKVPMQADWRLETPLPALAAYSAVVNDARFKGRLQWPSVRRPTTISGPQPS